MKATEIEKRFSDIRCWQAGGIRAPNKPLLLLLVIGKYQNEHERLILYTEIDKELRELLEQFGPKRASIHTEYPFCRLRNDGVWELENAELCELRQSNTDIKKSELKKYGVKGGLTKDIYQTLRNNSATRHQVIKGLLDSAFSESLHDEVLSAVGISIDAGERKNRDPEFRRTVLSIYSYRCAVCGYGVRFNQSVIGLEAAHIKWHQAGGPDIAQNGLALCSLHHKLFDYGAFTLDENLKVMLSRDVHGHMLEEHLSQYHGSAMNLPHRRDLFPRDDFLNWHQKQVFKSPAR